MNAPSPARVWCRSESRYAERPTAFLWEGQRVDVLRVLAQWRDPLGLGFRVLGADQGVYVLRYEQGLEAWTVEAVSSAGQP